ncbi:L-lactate dehydrogenase [Enterococcus sp. JM4C]|uniref:L-lactate dehydrogenase n=1 Tax=Candidatus Enterococcus huntleyi TaxID=1857217 RepID=UPI00137B73AC|nr:L-lactate dehydrogenase [Enterococcus sp. JM4C]KAF1297822.1 L-lactate dehydrogenase [Enterococcus sp. JM4C]
MRKIGIIGLGNVGSTLAYSLVSKGIADELVLIDKEEKKAVAEQYDLLDAQVHLPSKTVVKIQSYEELSDADIIVFCPGKITVLAGEGGRLLELRLTSKMVEEIAPKIKASGFNGIIVVITDPCDVITTYMQKLTGLPTNQVIGTGTLLDTARMKQAVGKALTIDSRSIEGFVYGEHGESQFVAWSTVTVGGKSIFNLDEKQDLEQLKEDARLGGWKIFSGKGYTSYGIATCTTALIQVIFNDAQAILPISAYDESAGIYYGQPAVVGKNGVERLSPCVLTDEESGKLQESITVIRGTFDGIVKGE